MTNREDFRCGVCQLKNAFHCEHDTPYRDQYLGMFDPNYPRDKAINADKYQRKPRSISNEDGVQHVNKSQPVTVRNQRNTMNKSQPVTVRNQQNTMNKTQPNEPTVEQKEAAAKSCVIL